MRNARLDEAPAGMVSPPLALFVLMLPKQKNIYFCFIDYAKAFDCVDHSKLWKILQEMGVSDHLKLPPENSVCRSRSNS